MLIQLHHKFKDGHTEFILQDDIETMSESDNILREAHKKFGLPVGAEWIMCNENSEYFMCVKSKCDKCESTCSEDSCEPE